MPNNVVEHRLDILRNKFNTLSSSLSECRIYRVHNALREVNKKAYEPELVSIGPYHRGKEKYQMMEEYKLRCLRQIVQRGQDDDLENYFSAMRSLVKESRKCYAEHVELDDDEFTEMLLLDSCFVVEVIRELWRVRKEENIVDIKPDWMYGALQVDLMLFENQLPFFVLHDMFDLIMGSSPHNRGRFIHLASQFFSDVFRGTGMQPRETGMQPSVHQQVGAKHLLEIIYEEYLRDHVGHESNHVEGNFERLIPCASKLIEAGVKFKKAKGGCMFDITYENGVIRIPSFTIYDTTECILRNLIAYEQYQVSNGTLFVTDYTALLDRLINTSKDVEILSKSGIVNSWVGDDEVVANIFNKIGDSVHVSDNFLYANLCNQVNDYYDKKRNRWMAILRRNYLNNPWAVISVCAAIILLALTVAQTVSAFLAI